MSSFSLEKCLRSFRYAWAGIVHSVKTENNIKVHLIISLAVIVFSVYLGLTAIEWICIVFCIGLVLGAELMNTAIEHTIDLMSPSENKHAMHAKDASAAAVLIIALATVVIGCIIFIPKILVLLLR